MKVALVHDYLYDFGGAEEVLVALREIYPNAPVYVTLLDKRRLGHFFEKFKNAKIVTSWFDKLPYASYLISPLRFLLPLIWKSFDFSEYDLIISSASWAITKGFKKGKKTIEICYLHTPPRSLYGYDTSRIWKGKWYGVFIDIYALIVNHFLRIYDFKMAQRVDYFIANSKNVGRRIEKFYRRYDYKVIYPPINVEGILESKFEKIDEEFYFTGGRMIAAKNFDLIIEAFNLNGKKLKIFGGGIDEKRLRRMAKSNVEFLGRITDPEKFVLLKNCKAFLLAQRDEDSGVTAIEMQAGGRPAIAYNGGGYVEVIIDGKTGIFFDDLTVESLVDALKRFEKMKFKSEDCINQAKKFSKERFKKEILQFVESKLKRESLKKSVGAWKGTDLDNDKLWKDILKRKSRPIDWIDKVRPKEWIKK